ncbi:sensor histidine kinase [Aquabacterium humicola]|uniref:sensor histidine kinase n=1 Tax=Aquabacterium humicola TaxID=3237377 RepID=UPI002542FA26|nr:ATP-binding protein [Rubrivivax pictus]
MDSAIASSSLPTPPEAGRRWSLQQRLWRHLLALLVAGWLVAGAAATAGLMHEINEVLDGALQQTASRLLAMPDAVASGPTVAPGTWPPGEHGDFVSWQLFDRDGRLRLRSARAPDAPMDPRGSDGLHDRGPWHVLTLTAADGRRVQVAETVSHRREVLWHALRWLLLALLAALPAVALLLRWLIRRAFADVEHARHALESLDVQRLEPLALPHLPDELQPWLRGTNALLTRLRQLIEAERTLALHTAHELRTPLAAARAQAQRLAAVTPDDAARGHAQALVRQIDRLTRLAARLLQRARLESGVALRREPVDLAELARLVADEFDAERRAGRLQLQLPASRVVVEGDLDALAIALRNLIENALRHGGAAAQVDVIAEAGPPARLVVQDDGPGVAPDVLPTLVRRFERGHAAREGSGLGLAIVDAIARQAGLRLVLSSPVALGRGLRAELRF